MLKGKHKAKIYVCFISHLNVLWMDVTPGCIAIICAKAPAILIADNFLPQNLEIAAQFFQGK